MRQVGWRSVLGVALGILTINGAAQAQGSLSADDRKEIQGLVDAYARYLGECRADSYADLFVPETGFFASGFRGHIFGRDGLIELVESERHCLAPAGSPQAARPGSGSGPTVEIAIDNGAVRGVAQLGTAEYQDEYAKTPDGWRFASRTVVLTTEKEAGLDAAGMLAIRRLGGDALGSSYAADDNGVPRLRTSGVQINVRDGVVTGRVYLAAGGYRDETYEKVGSGGWRVASSTLVPRPDLSGVWQFGRCIDASQMRCLLLGEDDPRLTARARAYRDAIDEVAQPKYDCAPMPVPHIWTDPYSYQIEQFDDRVVLTYGKDDIVRTIWLSGHGHPEPAVNEFFYFGYSTGYYEDDALVVDTRHFTFDPQGMNADFKLPSSTQKRVSERFSRDGDELILEVTTNDAFFLREPWSFRVRSAKDPYPLDLPWNCDLDGARQILKILPSNYPDDPEINRIEQ